MNKPVIKHCKNCIWYRSNYANFVVKNPYFGFFKDDCQIKYKDIKHKRLTALLCRHFYSKSPAEMALLDNKENL